VGGEGRLETIEKRVRHPQGATSGKQYRLWDVPARSHRQLRRLPTGLARAVILN
jgi:hypothetical protein